MANEAFTDVLERNRREEQQQALRAPLARPLLDARERWCATLTLRLLCPLS